MSSPEDHKPPRGGQIPVENISTTSPQHLSPVENSNSFLSNAGCSNQGNDSLPVTDVPEQTGIGQYSATVHDFSLNKPGSSPPSRCYLPLEQPFHKPRIQIVPTDNYALNAPETRTDCPILPLGSTSQQQMFPIQNKEMLLGPKGHRAAQASAKGTHSASHEAVAANGTVEDEIAGCSRVSHDVPHSSSPDNNRVGSTCTDAAPSGLNARYRCGCTVKDNLGVPRSHRDAGVSSAAN